MSVLSWLFGNRSTEDDRAPVHTHPNTAESDLFSDFLDLPSRNFFGPCSHSPNKRYTLGWRDANDSGSRGGARSSGMGRYILLERQHVLAQGRMARPNDGKVANNGVFILNDWEFTNDLSGVFSAFRPDGVKILSRRFKANLYNNGLSADGHLAVCQTCNSPDPNDSSVLTVFDLDQAAEIGSWSPESGWANFYEFPPDQQTIKLGYADGGAFTYNLRGDFIDRVKWADTQLSKGDLIIAERLLKAAENDMSPELANRLIGSIDIALSATQPADVRTRAWALKLRGLCLESQCDLGRALDCYEKALTLDPKIGVKRRAEQLRKALAK